MGAAGRGDLLAAAGLTEAAARDRGLADVSLGELRRRLLREVSTEGCRVEIPAIEDPAPLAPKEKASGVSFDALSRPVRGVRPLWSDPDLYGAFTVLAELAPELVTEALALCGETPAVLSDLRAEWEKRARDPEIGAALGVRRGEHGVVVRRARRGAKIELPAGSKKDTSDG